MLRRCFEPVNSRHTPEIQTMAAIIALVAMSFGLATPVEAATHQVATSTSNVDCSTFAGGVRPGDTIVLAGRSRGRITFSNCVGSADNPIVVRNDTSQSGPLVINMSGDGFQTQCMDCEHVVIDGTGKWQGAPGGMCGARNDNGEWSRGTSNCGIVMRCGSGSPHSGIRIGGGSKHVTIKGVEIDGNVPTCDTRIGISVNDHNYTAKAGEWREGIRILNNYVHDTEGEGIYAGPNQSKTSIGDLQLRNNEIAYNFVDRAGCDGINYKSAIAGSSSIHHNYVTNTGQSPRGGDSGCSGSGIALFEAGYTDVYSNYVEAPSPQSSGAGNCISQFASNLPSSVVATLPVRIFNNVVRNCKGDGISAGRRDDSTAAPVVRVFNNTVVSPIGGKGVSVGSSIGNCDVRDNIVAGQSVAAGRCSVTIIPRAISIRSDSATQPAGISGSPRTARPWTWARMTARMWITWERPGPSRASATRVLSSSRRETPAAPGPSRR
jgi:hypothetical protein